MYRETLSIPGGSLFDYVSLNLADMKANRGTETWRVSKIQNAVDVMMTRNGENLRFDN